MAFTSVITVDFSGTSHGSGDTFTVTGISNGESDTGVSYTDLLNGYTFQYTTLESSGFTVTAESGVCSGQDVGTVLIPTPTATPSPATATPTPTPGGATETATPTPTATPAYVQQWTEFYIDSTSYTNENDACSNAVLGTPVYFTSSIGTSFSDLITSVQGGTPVAIFTDNTLSTPFTSTTEWHGADSTGPDASYALLVNSSGDVGAAQACVAPTQGPESFTITAPDGATAGYTFDVTGSTGSDFTIETTYPSTQWLAVEASFPSNADPQYPEVGFTITTSTSGTGDGSITITVPANTSGVVKRSNLYFLEQATNGITGSMVITQNAS